MIDIAQSASGSFPLLSLLIITLPLGAAIIWLVPDSRQARWVALGAALADLAIALSVAFSFDPVVSGFQLVEQGQWIPSLNIQYLVGVDGLSVLFLPMTVVLFLGVIIGSWSMIQTMPRLYYTLLLLLESTTLGIFCALDTILFFLFWELTLIPLYFLISLWGIGPHRRYAAVTYTLFMLAGGIPLLFGFLLLAFNHAATSGMGIPDGLTFDYMTLLNTSLPHSLEVAIFFLLLLGFAVKTPLFPLHTWLPVVASEGPVAVTALMTGLKLGVYGIIRFVVPLAPTAAQEYHWLLAGLGVIGILYGALSALAQSNLRRMLAFFSISHVGLVLLGIASFNLQGLQGALFQMINFTIVSGGIFLLTGMLHHRIGSTDTLSLGGAAKSMPLLASFFLLFGLAAIGLPGTNGFPAEFLIFIGALKTHTGAALAALFGAVVSVAAFLGSYRRAFLGPLTSPVVADALDLRPRELLMTTVLAGLILLYGLFPSLLLDLTKVASDDWILHLAKP